MNFRSIQLSPQVIAQQIFFGLVKSLPNRIGFDFQRGPDVKATSNMVALETPFATSAFFDFGHLCETTMQFFDLSAHGACFLSDLRCHSFIRAIHNHPINLAICGNHLE